LLPLACFCGPRLAWAAAPTDAQIAAVLGIIVALPTIFLCALCCIITGVLKRREPRPWHVVYGWGVASLSLLIAVVLPVASVLFFAGTGGLFDAVLYAFPVALAGLWSAWLAWQLKARAQGAE